MKSVRKAFFIFGARDLHSTQGLQMIGHKLRVEQDEAPGMV